MSHWPDGSIPKLRVVAPRVDACSTSVSAPFGPTLKTAIVLLALRFDAYTNLPDGCIAISAVDPDVTPSGRVDTAPTGASVPAFTSQANDVTVAACSASEKTN